MTNSRNRITQGNSSFKALTLAFCLVVAPLSLPAATPLQTSSHSSNLQSPPPGSDSTASSRLIGQLVSFGAVTVNGRAALNGSSVPTNSVISVPCGPGNSAMIRLGSSGLVEVRPGATLHLSFAYGFVGGGLKEGSIRVRTPQGVRLDLATPNGRVTADGRTPTFVPVRVPSATACSYDQLAAINGTIPVSTQNGQSGGATGGAAAGSSGLSPFALAALIFGVGVAGAITIVALTQSGEQVSPTAP